MMSGRFRSDYLCRHWSSNKQGYCLAETCDQIRGDLEHLLLHCQALSVERHRLWKMFFDHSVGYPALYYFLEKLEKSQPKIKMQFFLDPTAFLEILDIFNLFGQKVVNHVYYLIRTYAYYLYRGRQLLMGYWTSDNLNTKYHKKRKMKSINTNISLFPGNQPNDVTVLCTTDGVTQPLPGPPQPVHLQDPNLYPVTLTQQQSDCDPRHSDQYCAGACDGWGGAGVRSGGADTHTSCVLKPELNSAYAISFSETLGSLSDNFHAGCFVMGLVVDMVKRQLMK